MGSKRIKIVSDSNQAVLAKEAGNVAFNWNGAKPAGGEGTADNTQLAAELPSFHLKNNRNSNNVPNFKNSQSSAPTAQQQQPTLLTRV